MASSFVWFGILLILLGIVGYNTPLSESTMGGQTISVTIPEAVGICNSAMGQLGQAYSGEAVKTCSEYNMLIYGIYGSGILGIVLIAVGAGVLGKKEEDSERKVEDDAIDILEKRYAKGEITKEEFDKMRKDLE